MEIFFTRKCLVFIHLNDFYFSFNIFHIFLSYPTILPLPTHNLLRSFGGMDIILKEELV